MSLAEPDAILVRLTEAPQCPVCGNGGRDLILFNEPCLDEDGQIGIEGIVCYARCKHRVPNACADPEKIAWVLEQEDPEDLGPI